MKRRFQWQSGKGDVTDAVARELDFHIEEHARDLIAQGMAPDDARAAARAALAERPQLESELRTLRGETVRVRNRRVMFEDWRLDLRVALRGLRRTPGFTLAAILTIALGIGANSAVFSMVRSVLLRPLPYPAAGQLVQLWTDHRARNGRTQPEWLTPPQFREWNEQNHSFSAMASYQNWQPTLTGSGDPVSIPGLLVSGDFFKVFAVRPELGRTLLPSDDVEGAEPVVVLSHQLWAARFGGDPTVINRTVLLNGDPSRVVGVMPAEWRAPIGLQPMVYRTVRRPANSGCGRGCIVIRAVGRLKPNSTFAQAQADIGAITRHAAESFPATDRGVGAWLIPLHRQVTGPTTTPLLVLAAAVLCVLLIACVNVANLLLLRGASRQRELGVRAALGAGRGRLVRQLLVESSVLALLGGALGLAFGVIGSRALAAMVPASVREIQQIGVDGVAVAYTAAISLVAAFLFGVLPALRSTRSDLMGLLRANITGTGHRGGNVQQRLVAIQLALAVVLVASAGLLVRSLVAMERVDLGYREGGVLLEPVAFPRLRYPPERVATAMSELADRLRAQPGIRSVEVTDQPPLAAGDQDMNLFPVGEAIDPQRAPDIWYRVVTPGYLQLMRMRLVAGRYFTAADRAGGAPVIIVNEQAAHLLWPGKSAVGGTVATGPDSGAQHFTVVGVVASGRQDGPNEPIKAEAFAPLGQVPANGFTVMIEPAAGSATAIGAIRVAMHDYDPLLPMETPLEMEHVVGSVFSAPRMYALIVGAFAVLSLLLASVGVYGVMAYVGAQRRREIGVRLALGATPGQILHALVWQGMRLALVGLVAGLVAAVAAGRIAHSMLFNVGPVDLPAFAVTALVLASAALLASWVPAYRAMRVDPVEAMRTE